MSKGARLCHLLDWKAVSYPVRKNLKNECFKPLLRDILLIMWVADLANLPSVRSSVQNPIAHELCVYFVYAQPLSLSRIWNQTYPQKHGPTLHYLHFEREGEFLFSPESSTGNEVELLPVTHSPDTLSFHIERVNDAVSQTRTEPHH